MAEAAMALQAVGSIVQGVGAYEAGRQNKRSAYEAATQEEIQGVSEEARMRDAARLAIGAQLGGQFSNGFQGGTGSALDALQQSQINAALDALTIRRDATSRARSARAAGDQAMDQGKYALAASLIGAGASAMGQRSDWAAVRTGSGSKPGAGSSGGKVGST